MLVELAGRDGDLGPFRLATRAASPQFAVRAAVLGRRLGLGGDGPLGGECQVIRSQAMFSQLGLDVGDDAVALLLADLLGLVKQGIGLRDEFGIGGHVGFLFRCYEG